MSARSFHSVFMVASCAGAALGCYLVSLRVASERAQLEQVESKIVDTQQDMRVLQTEIGTRGRLEQLQRWNVKVLALSAPAAQQFVSGGYELAQLVRNKPQVDFHAPVVMASAPAPQHKPAIEEESRDDSGATTPTAVDPSSPRSMLHEASYRIDTPEVPARAASVVHVSVTKAITPKAAAVAKSALPKDAATAKPKPAKAVAVAKAKPVASKRLATVAARPSLKKSVDKPALAAARPVTKPIRLAKNDPLAPLPGRPTRKIAKDTGSAR
jgi:hypothetical protein